MSVRGEWHPALAFAEFAEAIGISTTDVLAAFSKDGETTTVLFTRTRAELDSPVISADLARDADGIFVASPDEECDFTVGAIFKEASS